MHPSNVLLPRIDAEKTPVDVDLPVFSKGPWSLCAPDAERSCFGCCPPIRPQGYDPLDWVASLKREFQEHRKGFSHNALSPKPIIGFSCWALGYLDEHGRIIGCLLHPARHAGRDLRYLTGYEEKCSREFCLPARQFHSLKLPFQAFWLGLAAGLGSFYYASPRANPLFHVLLWGAMVLEKLATFALAQGYSVTEIVYAYPFLTREGLSPRGHRFLMEAVLAHAHEPGLWNNAEIEAMAQKIHETVCAELSRVRVGLHGPDGLYVHRMGLGEAFADYLRLMHGLRQGNPQVIKHIKAKAVQRAESLAGVAA